jgi:hypothetical protein
MALPFILMGPPTPIFVIYNHDVKSHEVTIEILDPDNKSIINETYIIESEGDLSQSRPLGLWLPQAKGEYMFKVTMDKKIINAVKIEIQGQYSGAAIRLYSKNFKSGEKIPILIETMNKL